MIIPVYNVENYLHQCLDSVINQTYKNLEIICVDDCSTDNSRQILKEYAQKDDRIVILQNERNMKAGFSRNKALRLATGDYIAFLDSDDWLDLDAYEKLVSIFIKTKAQVIQFILNYFSDGKYTNDNVSLAKEDKIYNLYKDQDILNFWSWHLCNRIYSKEFLEKYNIEFEDFPCFEDTLFSLKCFLNAEKIFFYNEKFYNYRKDNENSLTANYENNMHYAIKYFNYSIDLCKNLESNLKEKFLIWEFNNIYMMCLFLFKEGKIKYKEFKSILSNFDYNIFNKKNLKKGSLAHAQEILKYPEIIFNLKNNFRNFIKKHCPKLFKIILIMKGQKP